MAADFFFPAVFFLPVFLAARLTARDTSGERRILFGASVRHVDTASRPLRSEYVSGNYFTTLGVNAFGGRVFAETDDAASAALNTARAIDPAAPDVVELSGRLVNQYRSQAEAARR